MTRERVCSGRRISRVDVFRMIKRRVRDADLAATANCHTLRATGISTYLRNGGTLGAAQAIAAHQSPCTTVLYDPAATNLGGADIEKIQI